MRIVIIGFGNMGKRHYKVLQKLLNVGDKIALCDPNPNSETGVETYSDYHDIVDADAVIIATPPSTHYQIAKYFLSQSIPVLVEKPICTNEREARDLVKLAFDKNVPFLVGHTERFNPVLRKAKELISYNLIGDIMTVTTRRIGLYPKQIKDVDVVLDIGIHDVDIVHYLVGTEHKNVRVAKRSIYFKDRADFVSIFMEYANVMAMCQASWISSVKIRDLTVVGKTGILTADLINQEVKVIQNVVHFDGSGNPEFSGNSETSFKSTGVEPLAEELKHFISMVADGRSEDQQYAIDALKICLKDSD